MPSYPVKIRSDAADPNDYIRPPQLDGATNLGPVQNLFFEYQCSYFVPLLDRSTATIRMFKSTDAGQTWAEVDSANAPVARWTAWNAMTAAPADGSFNQKMGFSPCRDNSNRVHIAYIRSDYSLSIVTFSLVTQTWGTDRPGGPNFDPSSDNAEAPWFLAMGVDGFWVQFADTTSGTAVSVVGCTDGGTWGTQFVVRGTQQPYPTGIIQGTGNFVHTFYTRNIAGPDPSATFFFHRGFESGASVLDPVTLGTEQEFLYGFVSTASTHVFHTSLPIANGSEVLFALNVDEETPINPPATRGRLTIYVFRATSALDPTWTRQEALPTKAGFNIELGARKNSFGMAMTNDSYVTPTVVWLDRESNEPFTYGRVRYSQWNGAAWSAETLLWDIGPVTATCLAVPIDLPYPRFQQYISAGPISNGFGLINNLFHNAVEPLDNVDPGSGPFFLYDDLCNATVSPYAPTPLPITFTEWYKPYYFESGFCVSGPVTPTCTLDISPASIARGCTATLTWTTAGTPTTAIIDQGIGSVDPAGGSIPVSPTISTTYTLTVSNEAGESTCDATVTVAVLSCVLSADVLQLPLPGPVTLSWTTTNAPTAASINQGVGAVNPAGGSTVVTPPLGSTTYILTVSDVCGSITVTSICKVTINVGMTGPCPCPVPAPVKV